MGSYVGPDGQVRIDHLTEFGCPVRARQVCEWLASTTLKGWKPAYVSKEGAVSCPLRFSPSSPQTYKSYLPAAG
jgi:hypothetical protein